MKQTAARPAAPFKPPLTGMAVTFIDSPALSWGDVRKAASESQIPGAVSFSTLGTISVWRDLSLAPVIRSRARIVSLDGAR